MFSKTCVSNIKKRTNKQLNKLNISTDQPRQNTWLHNRQQQLDTL